MQENSCFEFALRYKEKFDSCKTILRLRASDRSSQAFTSSSRGHWVDRTDNKTNNVIYTISDEPLTEEEWPAKYCS